MLVCFLASENKIFFVDDPEFCTRKFLVRIAPYASWRMVTEKIIVGKQHDEKSWKQAENILTDFQNHMVLNFTIFSIGVLQCGNNI